MSQYTGGPRNRRTRALQRLKDQLATNGHPLNHYKETSPDVYKKQVARIEKEIATLTNRT